MTESLAVVLLLSLPLALRGALGSPQPRPTSTSNGERTLADSEQSPSEQSTSEQSTSEGSRTEQSDQRSPILNKIAGLASYNQFGLAAGIVSGLLVLLKPGMIPSVALSWLACLAISRTRLAVVLSLLIGAGMAVSPWMLYTKQTTGKAAITVQRMPVHNALIGWDSETSGWQTNPPSGFERVLNTGGEPLSTIEGIWMNRPQECLTILLEKFGHLYSTPWNDYRARVFGVAPHAQGIYHCFLLFAGLAGLFAWMLTSQRKNRLAILCVAAASGQCVYLMFEPVCRYAFPQFAFAPVLSALILTMLFKGSRRLKTASIALVLAAGCVELIAQSEAKSASRLAEIAHTLKSGETLKAKIKFSEAALKDADMALLLVDGDANLEAANVEVNGQKCSGTLLPFNYYDPQRYQSFNLLKELGYGLNVQVDDFRLWRAIPVPLEALKEGSANVTITPGSNGCTVYGDQNDARRYLSPDFLCVNRLINSKSSMEMRNESPILAGRSDRNWSFSDNPRIHVLIAKASAVSSYAQAERARLNNPKLTSSLNPSKTAPAESETFLAKLTPVDFDENMRTLDGGLKISKSILKAARTSGFSRTLPSFEQAKNLSITLEGDIKAVSKPGEIGIVVETVTKDKHECLLARLPSSLPTKPEWTHFRITDIAPTVSRQGEVNAISVAFFPGPWQQIAGYGADRKCTDTMLRNLRLEVKASMLPSLADKQLLLF